MSKNQLISVKPEVHEKIKELRNHPRETMGDVVERLVSKQEQ